MITIFNRKELAITFSPERQWEIRTALNSHDIRYTYKIVNRNSPSPFADSRASTGSFGINLKVSYEYIFYVHKKDYDFALAIINGHFK